MNGENDELARDATGPLTSQDFGPPRLVQGWDGFYAECARQKRLIALGYLRSWWGHTWGWGPGEMSDGRTSWHWCSRNWLPSAHEAFTDHERAWLEILERGNPYAAAVGLGRG